MNPPEFGPQDQTGLCLPRGIPAATTSPTRAQIYERRTTSGTATQSTRPITHVLLAVGSKGYGGRLHKAPSAAPVGFNLEAHNIAPPALVEMGVTMQPDLALRANPSIWAMALLLRRAADQFARARWEPNCEHLVIMSGETVVGSLLRQTGGTAGDRWI
jgi:hypothetical protein